VLEPLFVREVVVAIRHAETALVQVGGVLRRILVVDADEQHEWMTDEEPLRVADVSCELFLARDPLDAGELLLERPQACRLDRGFVHEARIEVADLLNVATARCAGLRGFLQDVSQILLRAVLQQTECAVVRTIRGNFGRREPISVHETVEVVLRAHRTIHVGEQHARAQRLGSSGWRVAQSRARHTADGQGSGTDQGKQRRNLHERSSLKRDAWSRGAEYRSRRGLRAIAVACKPRVGSARGAHMRPGAAAGSSRAKKTPSFWLGAEKRTFEG